MTEDQKEFVPMNVKRIDALPTNSPAAMMSLALSQGQDLSQLEKLLEIQIRWEQNEAKKAYHKAMSDFKANPPDIEKIDMSDTRVDVQVTKRLIRMPHCTMFPTTSTRHFLSTVYRQRGKQINHHLV